MRPAQDGRKVCLACFAVKAKLLDEGRIEIGWELSNFIEPARCDSSCGSCG